MEASNGRGQCQGGLCGGPGHREREEPHLAHSSAAPTNGESRTLKLSVHRALELPLAGPQPDISTHWPFSGSARSLRPIPLSAEAEQCSVRMATERARRVQFCLSVGP